MTPAETDEKDRVARRRALDQAVRTLASRAVHREAEAVPTYGRESSAKDRVARLEAVAEAAALLVVITGVIMPKHAVCGHDRRWLMALLDDVRAALSVLASESHDPS
jgi:hypothetical protein